MLNAAPENLYISIHQGFHIPLENTQPHDDDFAHSPRRSTRRFRDRAVTQRLKHVQGEPAIMSAGNHVDRNVAFDREYEAPDLDDVDL